MRELGELDESIRALDEFSQARGEACGWSAINHIVIYAHRDTEKRALHDVSIAKPRFLADAAYRHIQGIAGG
jgi:hypothetical protein